MNNQVVFTLKGKPLNVWDLKRDIVYKNDEMYNLMRALDIEDNIEHLRYDKVILATDADVDGLHIRNLLITYFFKFFEPLVHDGHLYVLETPLFRVRNKQETIYCYSEAERDAASAKLDGKPACVAEAGDETEEDAAGKTQSKLIVPATSARRRPEITRFKGLGEISPNEFKQFIGKEMRLRCLHTATGGIRAEGGQPADSLLLHGQEHTRAEGLHHGEPGGDGGGVSKRGISRARTRRDSNSDLSDLPNE